MKVEVNESIVKKPEYLYLGISKANHVIILFTSPSTGMVLDVGLGSSKVG